MQRYALFSVIGIISAISAIGGIGIIVSLVSLKYYTTHSTTRSHSLQEAFLSQFASHVQSVTSADKKKTIAYKHVATTVAKFDVYGFLADAIPSTIPLSTALTLDKPQDIHANPLPASRIYDGGMDVDVHVPV